MPVKGRDRHYGFNPYVAVCHLDIVIKSADLSVPENVYQLYEGLGDYEIETWINNAGFGNYDGVADR